jgi:trehalose utilization protein
MKIRVTVWGENVHEKKMASVAKLYPNGMHQAIADGIAEDPSFITRTATLDQPEHGLTDEVLDQTDVLTWWGHAAHSQVDDKIVDKVQTRVLQGMGLIVLHSGHFAKIFKRLMGTSCALTWREAGERERIWVCNPGHPIAKGLPPSFVIPHEEMYGEPFGVPDGENVFISWFEGGEVFRSGVCWNRGAGKIFYFRPGHETYPTYHQAEVKQVIRNAAHWATPIGERWANPHSAPNMKNPPEKILSIDPAHGHGAGGDGLR